MKLKANVQKRNNNEEIELVPGISSIGDNAVKVFPEFFNTIFIDGDITQESATEFFKATHYLDLEQDVFIVINSNGGDLHASVAIRNMIKNIRSQTKVFTTCVGVAFSASVLLLAAGTKGCRYTIPNSSLMIHTVQLTFGYGNYRTEIRPLMQSVADLEEDFLAILAEEVSKNHKEEIGNKPYKRNFKKITEHFHRGDSYLKPDDAKELGVVDHIGLIKLPVVTYEFELSKDENEEGEDNV